VRRKWLALALFCTLAAIPLTGQAQDAQDQINRVLDDFHAAAAVGDWQKYFSLMSADGVFLGSDAAERWPKGEFQQYAQGSSGWKYTPVTRHINLTPDGHSAWFDELLDSASYGTSRGSGILISTADGWKIAQYNLTFPIPNELVREITDSIKVFERK